MRTHNQNKTAQPLESDMTHYKVEEPIELLPFLLETFPKNSRNSVKAILTRGQIYVDGEPITKHNHPLEPGQTISIMNSKAKKRKSALSGITILHEDDDIIVINKEPGLLSIAGKDPTENTAYRQLTQYVKESNKLNRIFVVHRLDRDTSGVMLFAKTEDVKEALQKDWHTVVKERSYTAFVEGVVTKDEGKIASWLTESKTMRVHSSTFDNGGKHAVTHYKKIQNNQHFTLLEVNLETGRKNQIRVHMNDLGHPVVGDKKYGSQQNPLKRLGLHATTLALNHPRSGELVRFTAPVPSVFLKRSR